MAVSTKTSRFMDRGYRPIDVHSVTVTKSNKKGAAACFGGTLVEHKDGEFHIDLRTVINGKPVTCIVRAGDIVFTTGMNTRWQVLSKKNFNKRFTVIK